MRDDLLKEYIDSEDKKCIYRSDGFAFNYITCKCGIDLPDIHFVFGNNKYSLNLKELSIKFFEDPYCNIEIISWRDEDNQFLFNNGFLNKFNIEFDYDEKEINFYTEYKPLFIGSFIDKLSFKFNLQKGYLLGFVICLGLLLEILGIAALIKYYYVNIKKKAKKGYLRNSPDVIDGLITAQEI